MKDPMADPSIGALCGWLRKTCDSAGGLCVPISGGTDSALVYWLCAKTFPEKTLGVHIGGDLRCRQWFESLASVRFLSPIKSPDVEPEALYWAMFVTICWRENRWLMGSRNRTEDVMGTYSMPSRLSTCLPLAGTWKLDVLDLCKLVGVPKDIIASSSKEDVVCGRPADVANNLPMFDLFAMCMVGQLADRWKLNIGPKHLPWVTGIYRRNRFKAGLPTRGPIVDRPRTKKRK